jgi:tubulin-specific chaperone A
MLCPAKFYTLRLSKEHNLYTKEAEELKGKLDKFKAEKAEDWDINNTVLN